MFPLYISAIFLGFPAFSSLDSFGTSHIDGSSHEESSKSSLFQSLGRLSQCATGEQLNMSGRLQGHWESPRYGAISRLY